MSVSPQFGPEAGGTKVNITFLNGEIQRNNQIAIHGVQVFLGEEQIENVNVM